MEVVEAEDGDGNESEHDGWMPYAASVAGRAYPHLTNRHISDIRHLGRCGGCTLSSRPH